MFNSEKNITNFFKKFSQCKDCNFKRAVKRYYDNKDRISIQQNKFYGKKRDKLIQKHNDYRKKRNTDLKELHTSYVELQNKL